MIGVTIGTRGPRPSLLFLPLRPLSGGRGRGEGGGGRGGGE